MGGVKLMRAAAVLAVLIAAACETIREEPAAPAPPPPAPATPPKIAAVPPAPPEVKQPRSFLVFFETNKASLSDDARRVVREAADEYRAFASMRVVVLGHTDLVGSPRANQALSQRRAKAVLAALIGAGVPGERITAGAFGESQPAFVTPDGTPEPQNRRVEIYLR
jgi:outer membrane protein OmpA-like peptidoglycan-associated protein